MNNELGNTYSDADWKEILSVALFNISKTVAESGLAGHYKPEEVYASFIADAIRQFVGLQPPNGRQDN